MISPLGNKLYLKNIYNNHTFLFQSSCTFKVSNLMFCYIYIFEFVALCRSSVCRLNLSPMSLGIVVTKSSPPLKEYKNMKMIGFRGLDSLIIKEKED